MKVKLDQHEISILVNGLYSMRGQCIDGQLATIENLILKLIDMSGAMKPSVKRRIIFEPEEIHLVRHCLIDLRNGFLSAGQNGAAECVAEVLIKIG